MPRRLLLLLATAGLVACAPVTPRTGQAADPAPSLIRAEAVLTVRADGTVKMVVPQAREASLVVQQVSGDPGPADVWTLEPGQRFVFDTTHVDPPGTLLVARSPRGIPKTIGPGRYRVAGVEQLLDDVGPSFPVPGEPIRIVPACEDAFIVEPSTVRVTITLTFGGQLAAPCAISASLDEGPVAS